MQIATLKSPWFHCDIVGKEDTQPTNIRCFTCSLSDRFFLPQIKQKPTKMFKNFSNFKFSRNFTLDFDQNINYFLIIFFTLFSEYDLFCIKYFGFTTGSYTNKLDIADENKA